MEDWSFMKGNCLRKHEHNSSTSILLINSCHEQGATGREVALIEVLWPSPPGTFHILIGKFSYFIIRVYHRAIK